MLVLIGPPFSGSDDEYGRLAELTGLLPYELKTKLRPSAWGVVRALGDVDRAEELAHRLRSQGFRVAVVDSAVASDPARLFVPLRAVEAVVRGEVQVGSRRRFSSSATFRAIAPEASLEVVSTPPIDGFAAADFHFATVLWSARIDARSFDFSILGEQSGGAQDLDRLVDALGERIGVRVDRASKVSSVASFTGGSGSTRSATPMPGASLPARREVPERFDAYSRLVAEAERQALRHDRASARPPLPG